MNTCNLVKRLRLMDETKQPITLIVNCADAPALHAKKIYNTIRLMESKVTALCIGEASGHSSLIVAGCTGDSYMMKNSITSISAYIVATSNVREYD